MNAGLPPAENPSPQHVQIPTGSTGSGKAFGYPGPGQAHEGQPPSTGQEWTAEPVTNIAENATFFVEEDIYQMSPPVKVQYEEVFKESKGASTFKALAELNGKIFKWTQLGVYTIFSVVLGILLVIIWGILFGLLNFITVFLHQPFVKMTFVVLRPLALLFKAIVRSFMDPCWQSVGLIFSRVMGRFAFNITGLRQIPANAQQAAIQEI